MAIDAAIVKLMKARKSLFYNEIVSAVGVLLSKFTPDPKVSSILRFLIYILENQMIRIRLERLITQDILERDDNDSKKILYKA